MDINHVISELKTLSDEEIRHLKLAVLDDCERRDLLDQIPSQISDLAKAYLSGGGTGGVLEKAIAPEEG